MLKFGKKSKESVGLDVGTYSIKIAALKEEGDRRILTAYNIKKIPCESKPSEMKNFIKEALDEIDLHPAEVNLGFSGPNIIVRFIDFPRMSKDQLSSALNFEAEKYIPFNVSEVVMDFIILGNTAESGKMRVLLAAAKKDLVESRIKTAEELGMNINILDIDAVAVFNAFMANSMPQPEKGSAFFNFGHSQTDVLISIGETPCFTRQIQIGGRDILNSMVKETGEPLQKAEEMLAGIVVSGAPEGGLDPAIERAVTPVLDDLVGEMRLSFDYFENRHNVSVGDVYCSGGMLSHKGIFEYFASKTGFEMKGWDPLKSLEVTDLISREDIGMVSSQLAVAIGLALRQ